MAYHCRRQRADARRDAKLQRLGYRVVRVAAEEVMRELPLAVARVRAALLGAWRFVGSFGGMSRLLGSPRLRDMAPPALRRPVTRPVMR